MQRVSSPVVSDANKRAFMKLFDKSEFREDEWLDFSIQLSNFICGRVDTIDFINDYYLDYDSVNKYVSRYFGKVFSERLKKFKDEYNDLYKPFDVKEYLDTTKVIVDNEVVKPTIIDVGYAYRYCDDANIPPCAGNMNVAIRALLRDQISYNDPIEERREILKSVSNTERKARQYTYNVRGL